VINIEITIGSHHDNDDKTSPAAETKSSEKVVEASIRSVLSAPVHFKSSSESKKDDKKDEDKNSKTEAPKDQK
jgi:hypothetical protein